jgi:hypothetical protein
MAFLGRRNLLPILRWATPGLYLDGGVHGEILLPGRYSPPGAAVGTKVDVLQTSWLFPVLLVPSARSSAGGVSRS